jgi:tol-pal system protein YbgF
MAPLQTRLRPALPFAVLVLAGAALCAGPARAGLFDDDEARKQVIDLRNMVQSQNEAVAARVAKLESDNEQRGRAIIDLANQIDTLKSEIARLRGQIELLVNEAESSQKRQKDFYVDLDNRLRAIEKAGVAASGDGGGADAAKAGAPDGAEGKVYESALNQFKLGNYQGAIAGFQTFIQTWPSSANAPSAQYWIGNAYFALRDYKAAIAAQQKLIAAWPDSAKAPDAMLNLASSQLEMGDVKSARRSLDGLLARYPASPAAETAKQRLARMK